MHQSWDDYYLRGWGQDPDIARERLEMLRFEEVKAVFNPYDELYDPSDPGNYRGHSLDFACQCKFCVKKTTITQDDRKFLWSIRVVWNKRDIHTYSSEREALSEYDERQIWRSSETEALRTA